MYSFSFLKRRKKMDGIPLPLLWKNSCQEEMKTFSFAEEEGKRRRAIFLFSFLFSEGRRKGMSCRFWKRRKNGKRKRGRASSLVQAFDVLSAAACDEEVVLIVRTVVDVMPPLTTCVVRGFPSFRDETSIACPYGTGLSFILPEREEATA